MKISSFIYRILRVMVVSSVLLYLLTIACSQEGNEVQNEVRAAYELRIGGNADSAKVLLEEILAKDSTCAMARYELARTMHHIGLGNPRSLFGGLDKIQDNAAMAVQYKPDNVTYAYYNGYICYMRAYVAMMQQRPEIKNRIKAVQKAYDSVLKLRPEYHQATLFLVEILNAPEDMGGSPETAAKYAGSLESKDKVYAAKARELLLDQKSSRVEYWKNVLENNPNNAEVLEQLGKAYLYEDDVNNSIEYFSQAIDTNPAKHYLHLDLARFYVLSSAQDESKVKTMLPKAEESLKKYLELEKMKPLQAFAYQILSRVKMGMGDENEATAFREKANALDPNVSKAFGIPPALLFEEPDEISNYHAYFSRPF